MDLNYIRFSDNFRKFSAQLFQNACMKSSVTEFSRVPGCRQKSYIILKSVSTRDNFSEIFGSEIIPTTSCKWNYPHQKVYDGFLSIGSNVEYL